MQRSSGTPPASRTACDASDGDAPGASRWCRFGHSAVYPLTANVRAISLVESSYPGMWWMTTTPGSGPSPSGRARYAGIRSPRWARSPMVSARIASDAIANSFASRPQLLPGGRAELVGAERRVGVDLGDDVLAHEPDHLDRLLDR